MKQLQIKFTLILAVLIITVIKVGGQTTGMPEVFLHNSLKEQFGFLDEHTKIYDNFRAIREDMYQKIRVNVSDTLSSLNNKLGRLNKTRLALNHTIDSLKSNLESTKTSLDDVTKSKNSISVLGIEINKLTYNKMMWTVMAILVAALVGGFFVFKRNLTLIFNTKKEFQELKNEFEAYRKSSREAREKLTMDHFNEIKRIRGGG
jgi:chaperonin cofactor prefoldin